MVLDHILCRLRSIESNPDGHLVHPTRLEHRDVDLKANKLHVHSSLRINYTTYDLQRECDHVRPSLKITTSKIKPHSARSFIMVSTHDDGSVPTRTRFQHAQLLGIFHAVARDKNNIGYNYKTIAFLWVRWLEDEPRLCHGLQFVSPVSDLQDLSAFGIIDPDDVVRASYLVPAFACGPVETVRSPSVVNALPVGNWPSFYADLSGQREDRYTNWAKEPQYQG
jgi:hypothetical protein